MDLTDYLRVLTRRWLTILLSLLLGIAVGAAYLFLSPKEYRTEAQLFVSTRGGEDSNQLLQGSNFTQQRVKSYAETVTAPLVLQPVIDKLSLDSTPDVLAKSLEVTVPLDTVLIDITGTGEDPEEIARVVNAVSEQFRRTVPDLEGTSAGGAPVEITVLRSAAAPTDPISPSARIALAGALLGGLALGAVLALGRELLDTRVRREADIEGLSTAPVLGRLPDERRGQVTAAVVLEDPMSPRAEAFRSLRTSLEFVGAAGHARSLVMTSSVPGEGKTTISSNLALALAETGARVCVVEADLRRPRMASYLGLASGAGLTNLLLGDADLDDVLQPVRDTSLSFLGAGPIPPNPAELLGSPAMGQVVELLLSRFDHVLFDAPPLLPVTDASVLSRLTDGVLLVVGSGIVRKDQLRKALGRLDTIEANLLGLIIARLPLEEASDYYRDGYTDPVHDADSPRSYEKLLARRRARS